MYARYRAIPDDSITLDLLVANPITVKKIRAMIDAPRRVDESGEAAAAG